MPIFGVLFLSGRNFFIQFSSCFFLVSLHNLLYPDIWDSVLQRGNDVPHSPVVYAYLLVKTDTAELFVDSSKITLEVMDHLKNAGVELRPYDKILSEIEKWVHEVLFPSFFLWPFFSVRKMLAFSIWACWRCLTWFEWDRKYIWFAGLLFGHQMSAFTSIGTQLALVHCWEWYMYSSHVTAYLNCGTEAG